MNFSSLFSQQKGKIILVIVVIIVIHILLPMFSLKGYNILLDADSLNIYRNNELVASIDNPSYIMDTFNGDIVGIYVTDTSELGINRIGMIELYRLEFIKDGKIISTIKILTPKNQKDIDKIDPNNTVWRNFDGKYVIMSENFQYFMFGEVFFENLSEVLKRLNSNPCKWQ